MSLVLELRDHTRHGQNITLVHTGSEDVLTGTVFGILRNFRPEVFLLPWLETTCHQLAHRHFGILERNRINVFRAELPRTVGIPTN